MKRLVRLAARLYPARWRERYGRELDTLIEDLDVGVLDVWNVVQGALTMRITSIATVSVGLAVVGALAGTIVALRQPRLYESSATVRLQSSDTERVREVVESTFGRGARPIGDVKPQRLMILIDGGRSHSDAAVLRLASQDEDAGAAQRITQRLVDTLARSNASRATPVSFETLSPPTLPTEPSRPNHLALAGSGGGIGLLVGALVGWLRRAS